MYKLQGAFPRPYIEDWRSQKDLKPEPNSHTKVESYPKLTQNLLLSRRENRIREAPNRLKAPMERSVPHIPISRKLESNIICNQVNKVLNTLRGM